MKKNIANIAVFSVIILTLMFSWIFKEKEAFIQSERRKVAPFPPISQIFDDTYSREFDRAMADTFPLREALRKVNTSLRLDILSLNDTEGYYKADGHISKIEDTLNYDRITAGAEKINTLCETLLKDNKVWYSVIPDKNYFLAKKNGYPHIDYDYLLKTLRDNVSGAEYIDIFDSLSIDDYYKTDSHWNQEKIVPVARKIMSEMGMESADTKYTKNKIPGFVGVYAHHSAVNAREDIVYLTSDKTESTVVTSAEDKGTFPVYQTEKFYGTDSYDLFLGGAKAVLTLSQNTAPKRRLILFRDSFGSSIAPLFLENYDEIVLVDLRYISSSILDKYVNFENADVLFLYNTSIINNALLLR